MESDHGWHGGGEKPPIGTIGGLIAQIRRGSLYEALPMLIGHVSFFSSPKTNLGFFFFLLLAHCVGSLWVGDTRKRRERRSENVAAVGRSDGMRLDVREKQYQCRADRPISALKGERARARIGGIADGAGKKERSGLSSSCRAAAAAAGSPDAFDSLLRGAPTPRELFTSVRPLKQ